MSSHDLFIIVLFIGILVAFTPLLGKWLANVLHFQFHFFASIKSRQCQSCFNYSNIGAMPVNTKFYS